MSESTKYVIIVAGGSGTRMASSIPKQFLEIGGKPILMHTIKAFYKYDLCAKIILVLPESQQGHWDALCNKHEFDLPHQVVNGGHSRFASVKNGLDIIPLGAKGQVAIHDGVRPFVSSKMIEESFQLAAKSGNAIASVSLKESVRHLSPKGNKHVSREQYRLIQTPQTFSITLIKEAFETEESKLFTDDASVFEANGGRVNLYEGDYKNVKITTPDDLIWAEALLEKQSDQLED
ncbi:MAG: 2-C-methyl-D-erythritol 4-phosphate cytidylyltransferase [Bacteroidota bacterium]